MKLVCIIFLLYVTLSCVIANTITVTNTIDTGAGSLRDAIANATSGDTIRFDASLDMDTIRLTSGMIILDKNLVIIGNQAGTTVTPVAKSIGAQGPPPATIISGNNNSRIFYLKTNITIELSYLSLTGGLIRSGNGGAIFNDNGIATFTNTTIAGNSANGGGGVDNRGRATFTNTTIAGNNSFNSGGGLVNGGVATFTNTTISGNNARGSGGGVTNIGRATFINTTIAKNNSNRSGGGVKNSNFVATVTFINTNIAGNSATNTGGGVDNDFGTTAIFTNITIAGNTAQSGGGVDNGFGATSTFTNTTIAGNTATNLGGGVFNGLNSTATFTNTIVALNNAYEGPDINNRRTVRDGGNNLIGDGTGQSSIIDDVNGNIVGIPTNPINPLFIMNVPAAPSTEGDLRLRCESPAIDAGNNAALLIDNFDVDCDLDITELIPSDVLGSSRIVNETIDIGAHELDLFVECQEPISIPTLGTWISFCLALSLVIISIIFLSLIHI